MPIRVFKPSSTSSSSSPNHNNPLFSSQKPLHSYNVDYSFDKHKVFRFLVDPDCFFTASSVFLLDELTDTFVAPHLIDRFSGAKYQTVPQLNSESQLRASLSSLFVLFLWLIGLAFAVDRALGP
jgi:hypothetical protein